MTKRTVGKKTSPLKAGRSAKASKPAAAKPKPATAAGAAGPTKPSAAAKERRARTRRAMSLYEKGILAIQRRKFEAAAAALRAVVDDYPEERELHERARLYLAVCDRELAPPAPVPVTAEERVYAATLALNAGAIDEALRHLDAVAPESAHVQYMLAVTHALADHVELGVTHLERAIGLNPHYRLLARQEADFDRLHDSERFWRITASATTE